MPSIWLRGGFKRPALAKLEVASRAALGTQFAAFVLRRLVAQAQGAFMDKEMSNSMSEAGTGFMVSLTDVIHDLQRKGYVENLTPKFDHFECQSGKFKLYPGEIEIDKVIRFENASDPDDQAILFAICSKLQGLKGVYVDSYGLQHDELSPAVLGKLKAHVC